MSIPFGAAALVTSSFIVVFTLTSAFTRLFIVVRCTHFQAINRRGQTYWKMGDNVSPDLLQQRQIPDLPPNMFYIPNFITEDEEQRILDKVRTIKQKRSSVTYSTCLMYITDSRQPLDLPHTPPPAINPCSTHSKQHSSRLVKNATLADQPRCRSHIVSGDF